LKRTDIIKIRKKYSKEYYQKNKTFILVYGKKYCKANPHRMIMLRKRWEKEHPTYYLNWRQANPKKCKRSYKKYRQTEKGKYITKLHNAKRNGKNKEIIHSFSREQWFKLLKHTQGYCKLCKVKVGIKKLTLDHIFPISKAKKGRIYKISDVQPICKSCNSRKKNLI